MNRLAAAFSADVEQKVREKARDTIQENVQNGRLLADISCETQELLSQNKELKERLREMKLRMETMEETEKQLLCRSCCLRKVCRRKIILYTFCQLSETLVISVSPVCTDGHMQ